MILDIHSHHKAPQPFGVISLDFTSPDFDDGIIEEGQLYSLGIHPWTLSPIHHPDYGRFKELCQRPEIVAIGECGLDATKGAPMFAQMLAFKKGIEISEELEMPLIVHDVKCHDSIVALHKELKPHQPWVIHGFRWKPSVADMLLREGLCISFGEKFNPEALQAVPEDKLLAETDDSSLTIQEIIGNLSESAGKDLTPVIAANTLKLIKT